MPHIHTEPGQHDHVVTAYIIRTDFEEPKGLLHMHRKVHKLLSIGGHIELNETPWQAIAHELREESGYDLEVLKILQPKDRILQLTDGILHPQPVIMNTHTYSDANHSHTETAYAFVATAPPKHSMDEGESTDLRWYTPAELEDLSDDEVVPLAVDIYRHLFNVCLKHWVPVDTSEFQ